MGLVWYWKNSALYSIARAGLLSSPKTYFFAPISCYHRIRFHFLQQKAKRHAGKHWGKYDECTTASQLVSFYPSKVDIANIFHLSEKCQRMQKKAFFQKRTFT